MTKMTYIQHGDYLYPNLTVGQTTPPLGKYGRMRRNYLKQHRPVLWNSLAVTGKLFPHLAEIDKTAQERMEILLPQLKAQQGVTEELKAKNPMEWVARMNNIQAQVEEIIQAELIFS